MTFLPIVERELRVAARRPATYWTRFFAAVGVMLIWLFLVMSNWRMTAAALSQSLFVAFGVLALGFCLLAGLFFTADCLSSERREGTLGLLFLTDLRGYDVVLGKLMATSLHAVYGLLAIFPVLALPLLMGGVTVGEFWRVVLVLLATLVLSLGMGMFVSAWQQETRQTMAATFLGMLLLTGGLPAVWWLQYVVSRGRPLGALLLPSPANAFRCAFDLVFRTRSGAAEFWASVDIVFGLGVVLLLLAAVMLPRAWQERSDSKSLQDGNPGGARSNVRRFMASGFSTAGAPRKAHREVLLRENPFLWLASRTRPLGGPLGVLAALLALIWGCFFVASVGTRRNNYAFIVCLFASYALHQVFKYAVAVEATRRLSEDRQSGALELLLVTPLKEAEIIEGQKRALHRQFLGPAAVLVFINLAMASLTLLSNSLRMNSDDQAIFMELFIGGTVVLYLDYKALSLGGIWMALRRKRHSRAALATLGRVMLTPWAGIFLLIFMAQGMNLRAGDVATIFALWFGIGVVTDGLVLAKARTSLDAGIRGCMAQDAPPAPVPATSVGPELRAQHA